MRTCSLGTVISRCAALQDLVFFVQDPALSLARSALLCALVYERVVWTAGSAASCLFCFFDDFAILAMFELLRTEPACLLCCAAINSDTHFARSINNNGATKAAATGSVHSVVVT